MKFLFYFLSFGIFVGCAEKRITQEPTEIIKIFSDSITHYEEMFKKTETIFLETNRNCLISKISQLEVFSNKVFILDNNTKNIFLFNIKGKFLNKIGSRGKGPGQYIRPKNFIIDCKDSLLKVYDSAQKKIIAYNFNGDFEKEIILDRYLLSFGEWENGYGYWGYCSSISNSSVDPEKKGTLKFFNFNSNGKVIGSFEGEMVIDYLNLSDCYITNQHKGKVFFVEPFCDKISFFDGSNISADLKIDFSGNFLPRKLMSVIKDVSKTNNAIKLNDLAKSYVFGFICFLENDKWIYTFTPFHETSTLYNKFSKKAKTFYKMPFKEDNWETFSLPLLLKDDKIFSAINPSEFFDSLKDSIQQKYSHKRMISLQKLLSNVKENDNPIIFIYDLNK
jgi:hypothetical protein